MMVAGAKKVEKFKDGLACRQKEPVVKGDALRE